MAARAQFERCRALLRAELSIEPGAAVMSSAHLASGVGQVPHALDLGAIEARMTVVWQSFLAL